MIISNNKIVRSYKYHKLKKVKKLDNVNEVIELAKYFIKQYEN